MLYESKRSQSVIIDTILKETKNGINKTQLMYNANMSNTQLDRYLEKLLEKDFIEKRTDTTNGTKYFLTKKGETLKDAFKQVFSLFK